MIEESGRVASPNRLSSQAIEPPSTGSLDPTGFDPARVNEAYDRLHKFALEWKFMEIKSSYGDTVYELHSGDPRHAVCSISDIITLLEAVNGRAA